MVNNSALVCSAHQLSGIRRQKIHDANKYIIETQVYTYDFRQFFEWPYSILSFPVKWTRWYIQLKE